MGEMQVYIANLGKYVEGELVGAWFRPPIDYDEMAERIGLDDNYEEYAIHDYELPFEIGEYTSIEEINRLCELVEDLPDEIQEALSDLVGHFGSLEELCENQDRIYYYPDCDSMEDVAYYFVDELGVMDGSTEKLLRYFDYEAYGRDLETGGSFVLARNGAFEIAW